MNIAFFETGNEYFLTSLRYDNAAKCLTPLNIYIRLYINTLKEGRLKYHKKVIPVQFFTLLMFRKSVEPFNTLNAISENKNKINLFFKHISYFAFYSTYIALMQKKVKITKKHNSDENLKRKVPY